ncbi:ATP-dependent RNA helicase Dbp7 [Schizosaccharomyces cryophilus OY26]|uniref:ATP-dependent RNA helicase n=1 Tax=Schizosaccharomyces cryophilus (strain OY26 / ATCC MYA-4695 / CBS 11777 / NBRC 106824 / NRRL Y48691) TaxID=653667 RepID=S9XKM2_SCHCR|nr:ATP-dependent RNA helicase Dbp7 [Schizosaccharomyces cryophilus OY26]EPY54261.1 ATP-dependent RNA helicase Dbp7 [Schizosaccharomyces cryophilus OY26]
MAEESLLLNFVADEPSSSVNRVNSGGRWKDRMKEKKNQKRKAASSTSAKDHSPAATNSRKVQSRENVPASNESKRRKTAASPVSKQHSVAKPVKHDNTFVSSLFTGDSKEHLSSTTNAHDTEDENQSMFDTQNQDAPSNAPLSTTTFAGVQLDSQLASHLEEKMNITAPTNIQNSCLPALLNGEDKDAFIEAETGSGKTLAYLLPIIQRLVRLPPTKRSRTSGLFAVIVAPTRELCQQIYNVANNLTNNRLAHWIVSCNVIGGEKKKSEKSRIRKGVNILIGTPGRLADHIENTEVLDLSQVRWVVLDEGDRLMDMGFEETITKILSYLDSQNSLYPLGDSMPSRKVNVLCSATIKDTVKRLSQSALKDAMYLRSSSSSADENEDQKIRKSSAPAQLLQRYCVIPPKLRLVSLAAVLRSNLINNQKIIVFLSCADSVNFHFEAFRRKKAEIEVEQEEREDESKKTTSSTGNEEAVDTAYRLNEKAKVYRLHGSLSQQTRTKTLSQFCSEKDSSPRILLCTDVASRGLDLPNIDLVVQYDAPFSTDDYLHRIGRTARAGHNGAAIMFLLPKEVEYIDLLRANIKVNITEQPNGPSSILNSGFSVRGGPPAKSELEWQDRATEWQLELERMILDSPELKEVAKKAFSSYVRAYATHLSSERSIFNMRDLHLGHIAKSFALREAPGKMSNNNNKQKGTVAGARLKKKKDNSPAAIAAKMQQKAMEHYSIEHNIG